MRLPKRDKSVLLSKFGYFEVTAMCLGCIKSTDCYEAQTVMRNLAVLSFLLTAAALRADTVYFVNGREMEGKIRRTIAFGWKWTPAWCLPNSA